MKISQFWDDAIVPLVDYIRIPAKSPHFDKAWSKNGYIDAAVELAAGWCRKNAVPGMKLEVVRLEGRTPVLLIEVPAFQTVRQDRAYVRPPRQAARNGGLARRATGRGCRASPRASSTAAAGRTTATRCSLRSPRCARCTRKTVACARRGPHRMLRGKRLRSSRLFECIGAPIGVPDLVIGLDSGCGNYEQLWARPRWALSTACSRSRC